MMSLLGQAARIKNNTDKIRNIIILIIICAASALPWKKLYRLELGIFNNEDGFKLKFCE